MLPWDLENPYTLDIKVQPEDIDGLGHANNTVYVTWLERCAWWLSELIFDIFEPRER